MCIIIIKPEGKPLPTKEILEKCADRNSDGAGYMYAKGGNVVISKGFFELDEMLEEIEKRGVADKQLVLHFRIQTHGGKQKSLCHPFPFTPRTAQLNRLKTTCSVGVAHNGIFSSLDTVKNESDTQAFIKIMTTYPQMMMGFEDPGYPMFEKFISGSKLAVMMSDGHVLMHGSGWEEDKDDSCWYSNGSYKYTFKKSTPSKCTTYYGGHYGGYGYPDAREDSSYDKWKQALNEDKAKDEAEAKPDETPTIRPDTVQCDSCHGQGFTEGDSDEDFICKNCGGYGEVFNTEEPAIKVWAICPDCDSEYDFERKFCPFCGFDSIEKKTDPSWLERAKNAVMRVKKHEPEEPVLLG